MKPFVAKLAYLRPTDTYRRTRVEPRKPFGQGPGGWRASAAEVGVKNGPKTKLASILQTTSGLRNLSSSSFMPLVITSLWWNSTACKSSLYLAVSFLCSSTARCEGGAPM